MFPDKWYKKSSEKEIHNSREQLRFYSISKELELGINEVSMFPIRFIISQEGQKSSGFTSWQKGPTCVEQCQSRVL